MNLLLEHLRKSPLLEVLDRLIELLSKPGLRDVLANGAGEWWVDFGNGLVPAHEISLDRHQLDHFSRTLVALGGRHLDALNPMADVSIGSDSIPELVELGISAIRIHAVLASPVSALTLLSIRVHRADLPSLRSFYRSGALDSFQFHQLTEIAKSRANFLISGPTGSGKTTLLRAMLAETPDLRTVAVEDVAELAPVSGHFIGLQTRPANIEGAGMIDLAQLAREALRMRPDRFVVGEVRGPEAKVLLQAMNTGHLGSAATIHANSADSVIARFRLMLEQPGLSDASLAAAITAAIQFIVHLDSVGRVSVSRTRPA